MSPCDPTAQQHPMPPQGAPIRAKVLEFQTGKKDKKCVTTFRCNGTIFHVYISPEYFKQSPLLEARYLKYLHAMLEPWNEDSEQIEEEFEKWLLGELTPTFSQNVPYTPPSFDTDKIRNGQARPMLSEYLFPRRLVCKLEASDDKVLPRLTEKGAFMDPNKALICKKDNNILRKWVKFIDASVIEIVFENPEDALTCDAPTRVLADLDGSGKKTLCFFKLFQAGQFGTLTAEVDNHARILEAKLPADLRIGKLVGVVTTRNRNGVDGFVPGLLLKYVDHERSGILEDVIAMNTASMDVKQRWARQIEETVLELHKAGVTWGDAKTSNVMIDKEQNAWLIDFGGGYTEGWVDEDKAETVEGDLQGVERIVKSILEGWYPVYDDDEEIVKGE